MNWQLAHLLVVTEVEQYSVEFLQYVVKLRQQLAVEQLVMMMIHFRLPVGYKKNILVFIER